MPPPLSGVLETSVYVADLARAVVFYRNVLGLQVLATDHRFCAFAAAPCQVLLVFVRGTHLKPSHVPGGTIPPHDASGSIHCAFAVAEAALPDWERHLVAQGVAIEGRVAWPQGGQSLYFRDPDGNLLELASPGLWANYTSLTPF
jgi:catechol 2,3-dioxygenase-like lactoylglutathione lyase family enzyme